MEVSEMKKYFIIAAIFLVLLIPSASIAKTDVFLNFGVGLPFPFFVAPAPVVVAPPPVVVAPAPVIVSSPVYYQPGPVYYGYPGWYTGKYRGGHKYYRYYR